VEDARRFDVAESGEDEQREAGHLVRQMAQDQQR
jgi:hypothetical protein